MTNMVSLDRIEQGAARFIDNELVPKLPIGGAYDGVKKMAVVASAIYLVKRFRNIAELAYNNNFLSVVGLYNENGEFDLDGIRDVMKEQIPADGMLVKVPLLNELRFYKDDVDKLYSYIMGVM